MKYTEEQLTEMAKPASDSEETRMNNATKMVKDALASNGIIADREFEVFAQGSYANNTNIRNNSDIDINVCYTGAFYYDIPPGKVKEEYGFTGNVPYTFKQFKNDIETILVKKFGRDQVVRKNKCIHIKGNTYRTDIDVVPTWEYRRYRDSRYSYVTGVKLFSDDGDIVINFPKQHLSNGITFNNSTQRRYKRLVRIVKRIHLNMENERFYCNSNITSFLIESMVYLLPQSYFRIFNTYYNWNDIIQDAIRYWWNATKSDNDECKDWTEVSELLCLLTNHKWDRSDIHEFTYKMWNYLGY